MKKLNLIAIAFCLSACDSDNSDNAFINQNTSSQTCSQETKNNFWFEFLQETYLWNDALPASIDPFAYANSQDLLADLKAPQDKFSFVVDSEQWDQQISGASFGYGFRFDYNESNDYIRVIYSFKNSGAALAGLKRGDRLTKINGHSAAQVIDWFKSGDAQFDLAFGEDINGETIEVTWLQPDGSEKTADIVKGEIQINTVMANEVLDTNAGPLAYLSFQHGFLDNSSKELDEAFLSFNQDDLSTLILDLRYNSGGRLDTAGRLAAYIAGSKTKDKTFIDFNYNFSYAQSLSERQLSFKFNEDLNSVSLSPLTQIYDNSPNFEQVIVLTREETCSASESVINGLRPYIDKLITIGDTTCGKPVGMAPQEFCQETMLAINFQTLNADGFGDYFDGIPADCTITDNITVDRWGSINDEHLSAAINYAETNRCPTQGLVNSAAKQSKVFQQNKTRVNNLILPK